MSEHLNATYPDLAGRTALVTGGARGLGSAIATSLARSGAHIALTDVSNDVVAAAERVSEITEIRAVGIVADVTDEPAVRAAFAEAESSVGGPTVLVNSAGIGLNAGGRRLN